MAKLKTSRGEVYFECVGKGPAVFLIHGLSRSSRFWGSFRDELAVFFTVVTIDARGLGKTLRQAGWLDKTSDLARDCLMVLNHLGLGRCHLIGQSLGGMVALSFGALAPERLLSITVINSSSRGTGELRVSPAAICAMILGSILRPLLVPTVVYLCTGLGTAPEAKKKFRALYSRVLDEEGLPWRTTLRQMLTAIRFRLSDTSKIPAYPPVMILCSGDDRFVPSHNSRALHRLLPKAEFHLIPGAGHELPLDRPDILLRLFKSFVRKQATMDYRGQDLPGSAG